MKGTVEFDYDPRVAIVVARPRWTLDSATEVMRWHQVHANYFKARFRGPKDMVVVNDHFDVVPKVAELWGSYRAKLHQTVVGVSVCVNNSARVRQNTQTSGVRHTIGSLEAASVEEAVAAILAIRDRVSGPQRVAEPHRTRTTNRRLAATQDPATKRK
jgi:hypothetical protein